MVKCDDTDMVRRSSADVFLASQERDNCAPHVDVLRGRRSTGPGVLDQIRTSSNTARQHTPVTSVPLHVPKLSTEIENMATFKRPAASETGTSFCRLLEKQSNNLNRNCFGKA